MEKRWKGKKMRPMRAAVLFSIFSRGCKQVQIFPRFSLQR